MLFVLSFYLLMMYTKTYLIENLHWLFFPGCGAIVSSLYHLFALSLLVANTVCFLSFCRPVEWSVVVFNAFSFSQSKIIMFELSLPELHAKKTVLY